MTDRKQPDGTATPAVARLRGVLKDAGPIVEADYRGHLKEKYLRGGEAHGGGRGNRRDRSRRDRSAKQSEQDGDHQPGATDAEASDDQHHAPG